MKIRFLGCTAYRVLQTIITSLAFDGGFKWRLDRASCPCTVRRPLSNPENGFRSTARFCRRLRNLERQLPHGPRRQPAADGVGDLPEGRPRPITSHRGNGIDLRFVRVADDTPEGSEARASWFEKRNGEPAKRICRRCDNPVMRSKLNRLLFVL